MNIISDANETNQNIIIYVDDDGTADYTNIQDAIDNATDGDTIFVFNGVYKGNIVIDKSINLFGEDTHDTFIICQKDGATIEVTDDQVVIINFTIINGTYGISLNCNQSRIFNNIFSSNVIGIRTYFLTMGHIISDNTFSFNDWKGINLFSSKTTIIDNIFTTIDEGISIGSTQNIISNNSFIQSGITLFGDTKYPNYINNNTVNSKPLIYLENETDKQINTYAGQIILVNCHNIKIQNQNISNTTSCVQLSRSENCSITNNYLSSHSKASLVLYNSKNNKLSENILKTFYYSNTNMNENRGISLEFSSHNIISNNTIIDNNIGVYLSDSNQNKIFRNNMLKNQYYGLMLVLSHQNNIYQNNFIENPCPATFTLSMKNRWMNNFWDRPRFLPKPIFGVLESQGRFFPFINFDWNPAKNLYEILK